MDLSEWLPFYPDVLPRRRSLQGPALASQPPYNAEIFPVPDVLAGLTFLPTFPDRVPHTRTPREMTWATSAAVTSTAVRPLSWGPTYPDRVPHRRFRLGNVLSLAAPPPGQQVYIATSLAWMPRYPDWVAHHRALQPAGATAFVAPLTIVSSGYPCIDLALDTCTTPTILAQGVTTSAFSQEGLGSPGFIDENFCT
jgi:hypothetical protein